MRAASVHRIRVDESAVAAVVRQVQTCLQVQADPTVPAKTVAAFDAWVCRALRLQEEHGHICTGLDHTALLDLIARIRRARAATAALGGHR